MLIDEREAQKRGLRLKHKAFSLKKRRMNSDDYEWRADPVRPEQPSCLAGGYKSIKHKWLCQYLKASLGQDPAQEYTRIAVGDGRESDTQLLGSDIHQGCSLTDPGLAIDVRQSEEGNEQQRRRKSGAQGPEQALESAAIKCRKQAESEVKASREEDARRQTESSLANEQLQIATKNVRKEAEEELSLAAEKDRGARAQKSLRKELAEAETPKSARGSIQKDGLPHQKGSVPSNQVAGKKVIKKRPMSSPGMVKSCLERGSGPQEPQSASKKHPSEEQRRPSSSKSKLLEKRKRSGMSSQSKEDVAENEGKMKPRLSSPEWRRTKSNAFNDFASAIDSHPLVQVTFVDGSEREHLGELDLHQLDSFRDLWRTIRSAFSARLPRGDFKLVYRDVDNDLMIHKSEPWDYFKAAASSLLLISKGSSA